jgi:hypothetical protein
MLHTISGVRVYNMHCEKNQSIADVDMGVGQSRMTWESESPDHRDVRFRIPIALTGFRHGFFTLCHYTHSPAVDIGTVHILIVKASILCTHPP